MVPRQEKPNVAESRRPLMPKDQGERPQGTKKQRLQQPVRKSARLQKQIIPEVDTKYPLPSPSISTTPCKGVKQSPPKAANSSSPQNKHETTRKRKRSQAEAPWDEPAEKRVQTSPAGCVVEDKEVARDTNQSVHPVEHWIQEGSWPGEYFEPVNMDMLPKRRKSIASLQGKDSEANTSFIGGDATQAARSPGYEKQLNVASIFLDEDGTISNDCAKLYHSLLNGKQPVPQVSLFQDDMFRTTINWYRRRSESIVFRDITPLIVPSAELCYRFSSAHLEHVREDLNTLWTKCICLADGPRPKPDFAVGLKESVFTRDEYEKLKPYIGGSNEIGYVKVTDDIFFPFLTCEAKCGEAGLDVADRQNAHSASIAVNAIVRLYKAVKLQEEVNRKVLAFSISHDNQTVRIYGHYPIIDGDTTKFYRYAIHKCYLTAEKWTAYKFTRNVYDIFLPAHVKRIKSAVIQLPDPKDLVESLTSIPGAENDPEPPDSQMAPPSQDTGSQKGQKLPPKVMLQQENDRQRQEIDQLRREKDNQTEQFMRQLELQRREMKQENDELKDRMKQENDELKDRMNQLMRQIDLLLRQQAHREGSNASSKLQSSEASGLSQVFGYQSLSQQSNPNTTSPAGNDGSQSNLTGSITSNTSLSHGIEPEASQQPKKRRAAESQRQGVGRK